MHQRVLVHSAQACAHQRGHLRVPSVIGTKHFDGIFRFASGGWMNVFSQSLDDVGIHDEIFRRENVFELLPFRRSLIDVDVVVVLWRRSAGHLLVLPSRVMYLFFTS